MKPWLMVGCLGLAGVTSLWAQSIEGDWKTIDDKTGAARSVVRIQAKGSEWEGVLHQRLDPNAQPDARCTACPGDRKDQPLQGLTLIRGLKAHAEEAGVWEGGTILDPESGTEYRLKVRLTAQGQQLEVRGYVGVPLLGRTQVWLRQP